MNSLLSRCITGVLSPWFAWRGPAKVGACNSILFTESSILVEIKYCKYYSRYSILYVRTRSKFITDYILSR